MIRVIKVLNPFQPGTQRVTLTAEHVAGLTIDELLRSLDMDPAQSVAVIDGKAIPPDLAAGYPVEDGRDIIVMPYVGGGGFLKTFAEIAVIAVAAVVSGGLGAGALAGLSSGVLGSAFAAIGLGGLSVGTAALIGAGIAIGGNLLINAFMSSSAGGGIDTATYDPSGPKTTASGGTPIPKGYGLMRWGGNIIASNVDAEGQDNYLNVLVCFGWGPANSITDIRLNGTSIQDYAQVTYQIRLGSNTQQPIPYFNNIKNGYPQAIRCLAGQPVIVQGTGETTQGLEVTVQFPDGVFYSNDDGSLRSLAISYLVEYSVSGTGNWQPVLQPYATHDIVTFHDDGTVDTYPVWVVIPNDTSYSAGIVYSTDSDPSAHYAGEPWNMTESVVTYAPTGASSTIQQVFSGEWQLCDPTLNQQAVDSWSAGYQIMVDKNQAALYQTTHIYNLPPNKYDVRVTKYGSAFQGDPIKPLEANNSRTGDQIWIHNINEVQYQDLQYPNMILLGIRALASNQLSGSQLNITALVDHGIQAVLPDALAPYGTDNPAVVAYDMLCSDAGLYGGGIDPARVNTADLAAWAAFNDELVSDGFTGQIKRHVFNGVFDQQSTNLWKSLQKVGSMSQCIPVPIGRDYGFIIDQAVTVPAQVFTVGNMKRDSLKDTWMSLDDRANRVEVTFADAGRDYRTDEPCAVMTPSDIAAGVEIQTTRVALLGCTVRAQAWHWAYRKLLSTKTAVLSRTFDVGVDAVACQIGSVIGVQDDTTQWAYGGRIQPGSTTTALVVDRSDLPYVGAQGWTVSVVHPTVLRGSVVAFSVAGMQVTFTEPLPAGRVLVAVKVDGTQLTCQVNGPSSVLLDVVPSTVGVAFGTALTLYDQDVVDTQLVSAYVGETLTPAAPFLQAPAADAPWVYGQSAGAFPAKLFRVTNLRKKGDFDISIDCINYDPSVYADDTPIITETLGVPDVNAAVSSLVLNENYVMANGSNGGQTSSISVGWQNGRDTVATELWIATNEVNQPLSNESLLATVSKGTTYTFPAATGAIVQIRAVGLDGKGATASWNTAPIATITVQGSGSAPGDVTMLNGSTDTTGTYLAWLAPIGAVSYEVRYNTNVANTSWTTAVLLYAGTATMWADPTVRFGRYLVKAISAATVESVNSASYSYLESNNRLNLVGFPAGQNLVVQISSNTVDQNLTTATVYIYTPSQPLTRSDGTIAQTNAAYYVFAGLSTGTTYTLYPYINTSDYSLHSGAGDGAIPDTAPNQASATAASAAGRYPGTVLTVTTPGSNGSGGTTAPAPYNPPVSSPPSHPKPGSPNPN